MSFAQPFANYEILARVGAGAMGTVFKARQKHLNRIVALKVLKPALARDARYVERLEREARTVARLNHQNIVTAYDLGHEGGYHYFVMEFVEGRSLRQLLAEWGAFPESQVLDVAIQMASALSHAFECGVIHRDVKPANILIDAEGRAKLTDLGLARAESDLALTRDGATVGTPQYISPEQARNPHDADIRSDLYSLGATLFHMLTGQPPFKAEAIGELITKVLHERPPSVVDLVPEISDGLSLVVRRLLAKNPRLRYQTPAELLADLHRVERRERPQVDIGVLDAEARPPRRPRPQPTRRPAASLFASILIVGVALGFVAARVWGAGPEGVDVERLARSIDTLQPDSARFARLAELAASATPPVESTLVELRRRLVAALDARVTEELAAVTTSRRAETERELGAEGSWESVETFIREVVVARIDSVTGFRPENLPDPRLRQRVTERLAALRNQLSELTSVRDRALEVGFDRRLREQVLPAALRMARAGRPDLAQAGFRPACDVQLAKLLHVPVSALSVGLRARIDEIGQQAAADLDREIGKLRGELASQGLQRFTYLRERYDEAARAIAGTNTAPTVLRSTLDAIAREIEASIPAREVFLGDSRSPWPAIDDWLGAQRVATESRCGVAAARAFEQALDLAYQVLPEGGPEVAARVLLGLDDIDSALTARIEQHRDILHGAASLRDDLFRAILGDRDHVEFQLDGSRGRQPLEIKQDAGGRLVMLRATDHRVVEFGGIDLEALRQRPEVPDDIRNRSDEATLIARACSLSLWGSPSSAVALLDGEALALFCADCAPRLKTVESAPDLAESAAREALDRIARLRECGDSIGLRDAIARFEQDHADSAVLRGQSDYLRGLRAWAVRNAAREERRLALRARVPDALRVVISDDDVETVSGQLGDLPSTSFSAGWSRERGVAEFAAHADGQGGAGPVRFESPFGGDSIELTMDVEVRFGAADRTSRIAVVELNGIAAAIVVLPAGQVTAILLPADEADFGSLGAKLADPMVEVALAPPRIVPGVWHHVRLVLHREGGATSARVELDGLDRVPLCKQVVQPSVAGVPAVGFRARQLLALRQVEISRRGP